MARKKKDLKPKVTTGPKPKIKVVKGKEKAVYSGVDKGKGKSKTVKTVLEVKEALPQTKADKIWNKIKNLDLGLFGLENQTTEMYCRRINVSPDAVHLILKASSVITALEDALHKVKLDKGEIWDVEQAEQYVILRIIKPKEQEQVAQPYVIAKY